MTKITVPEEPIETNYLNYSGSGPLTFDWSATETSNVSVSVDGAQLLQNQYSVTAETVVEGGIVGGSVTLNTAVSSQDVVLFRQTPVRRTANYAVNGLNPDDINKELSRMTMIDQEQGFKIDRFSEIFSFKSDDIANSVLLGSADGTKFETFSVGAPNERGGRVIAFNLAGNLTTIPAGLSDAAAFMIMRAGEDISPNTDLYALGAFWTSPNATTAAPDEITSENLRAAGFLKTTPVSFVNRAAVSGYTGDAKLIELRGLITEDDGLGGLFRRVDDLSALYFPAIDPDNKYHIQGEGLSGYVRVDPYDREEDAYVFGTVHPKGDVSNEHLLVTGTSIAAAGQGNIRYLGNDRGGSFDLAYSERGGRVTVAAFPGSHLTSNGPDFLQATTATDRNAYKILMASKADMDRWRADPAVPADSPFKVFNLNELYGMTYEARIFDFVDATIADGNPITQWICEHAHNDARARNYSNWDTVTFDVTAVTTGAQTVLTVTGNPTLYDKCSISGTSVDGLEHFIGQIVAISGDQVTIDLDSTGLDVSGFTPATLQTYDMGDYIQGLHWELAMELHLKVRLDNPDFFLMFANAPSLYTGERGGNGTFEVQERIFDINRVKRAFSGKYQIPLLDFETRMDIKPGNHVAALTDSVHPSVADDLSAMAAHVAEFVDGGPRRVDQLVNQFKYSRSAAYDEAALFYSEVKGAYTEVDDLAEEVDIYAPTLTATTLADDGWVDTGSGVTMEVPPSGVGDASSFHFKISDGTGVIYRDLGEDVDNGRITLKIAPETLIDAVQMDVGQRNAAVSVGQFSFNFNRINASIDLFTENTPEASDGTDIVSITRARISIVDDGATGVLNILASIDLPLETGDDGYITLDLEALTGLSGENTATARLTLNGEIAKQVETILQTPTLPNKVMRINPEVARGTLVKSIYMKELVVTSGVRNRLAKSDVILAVRSRKVSPGGVLWQAVLEWDGSSLTEVANNGPATFSRKGVGTYSGAMIAQEYGVDYSIKGRIHGLNAPNVRNANSHELMGFHSSTGFWLLTSQGATAKDFVKFTVEAVAQIPGSM